ncbi:ribonucleoside diphosphate reductase large subunit [Bacillus phage SWEP1]|nr:ribonucleoside diphosphate reductase large subunit [Bacillus phage SWEP1]
MFQFIGRGSAFNTLEGNNSAYCIHEGELFLIDCGSNIFERLDHAGILSVVKNIKVLITHTHDDHIGSLGGLIFHSYFNMGTMGEKNITVYAPYTLKVPKILDLMGVTSKYYHIKQFESHIEMEYANEPVMVQAVPNNHVEEILSYGYLIDIKGKHVYYSGDANSIHPTIMQLFQEGEIDYFYQDTCGVDYEGNVHMSLKKLSNEIIYADLRKKTYCMHLDKAFSIKEARGMGFNVVESVF